MRKVGCIVERERGVEYVSECFDCSFLKTKHSIEACVEAAGEVCRPVGNKAVNSVLIDHIGLGVVGLAYRIGVPTFGIVYGVGPIYVFEDFDIACYGNGVHNSVAEIANKV